MNLLELRTKAMLISGRYDLVNPTTYADQGMDYYINAGQRWLDRKFFGKRAEGRFLKRISAGDNQVNIQLARSIREVWYYDTEARAQLTKAAYNWLKTEYPDTLNIDESGTPLYYTPIVTRGIPHFSELPADEADFLVHEADLLSGPSNGYDAIRIYPATDAEITIEVLGLFYSNPLTTNTSESYWSVTNPDILLHATYRAIEIDHRNRQGVDDWTAAIMDNVGELQLDDLDEEITDINQMEG